jgi:phosphoribosylaminoimidazole-succinocarboxamide synthase
MVATDRLSAFDVVLPKGIPYKGKFKSNCYKKFMELTADIVPNWLIATQILMLLWVICAIL